MNKFLKFINEARQAHGLSLITLFEANKLYVFKNGTKWIVESADQDMVTASEADTEEVKQFTQEEFDAQVNHQATAVVDKQEKIATQQKNATQQVKQVALQSIAQGQAMCDECGEDKDCEKYAQGKQMIEDGHKLLQSAQETEEAVDAATVEGDAVAAQILVFDKAQAQAQDAVKILSQVINELIPPSEEITIAQLAKQSAIIARSAAIANTANDVLQSAMQKQNAIIDAVEASVADELRAKQTVQIDQSEGSQFDVAAQKIAAVQATVQQLVDDASEEEKESINEVVCHLNELQQIVDGLVKQQKQEEPAEVEETEESSVEEVNQSVEETVEQEEPVELEQCDEAPVQEAGAEEMNQEEAPVEAEKTEEVPEETEVSEQEELQVEAPVDSIPLTQQFEQKLAKAQDCLVAQQVAIAQTECISQDDACEMDTKIQDTMSKIEQAQQMIVDDVEVETFKAAIDDLCQQIEDIKTTVADKQVLKQEDEEVSLEDIAQDIAQIKQTLEEILAAGETEDTPEEVEQEETEQEEQVQQEQSEEQQEQADQE
jgi:hypothetical protein